MFWIGLLALMAACSSGSPERPGPRAAVPGGPVVVRTGEIPAEVTGLLSEAEADSCGVCIREKRADAFALARQWFAPGHRVRPDGTGGWRLLAGGEQELVFASPEDPSPRLTFRFHTEDDHLVGIDPADFTDPALAAELLARPSDTPGSETLEVVAFAYGDGPAFLFDEATNRIQVQCRVLPPGEDGASPARWGEPLRQTPGGGR